MSSAPKAPAKAPDVHVGDLVLDRYRVLEQIGSGGHSVVFKGTDERLSRPVCIKVFSGLGGHSGVGRTSYEHFVQEAFALSRLTHPNTLRIYDFGHLGTADATGNPLQVCEYMNAGTLSQIIREEGKQSLDGAVKIVSAMCAALAEAHGLGITHRDIKPQNILFTSVGANRLPKLADFGIAKWSAASEDESNRDQRAEDTQIVAGQKLAMYSPSWAAPEQLAGQPVSAVTDIYSLAVVAVYMISGKAIFADEDVYAGYKKRRNADALVADTLAPCGAPRSLADVLAHALAFDPRKRTASVEALATALHAALHPPAPTASAQADRSPRPVGLALPPPEERRISDLTPIPAQIFTPPPRPGTPPRPATEPPPTHQAAPALARTSTDGDLTPATYHAKSASAWMANAPQVAPDTTARRLALADGPHQLGDRRVHFMLVPAGVADLVGGHGTKVRATLMHGPGGARVVHLKGLSCFVAPVGGRPSPAMQITQTTDVALVTPRAQEIGHLRVAQGAHDATQAVFTIGAERVAIATEECADPILFDFGPGSEAYFVYTQGHTLPKSGRRG